MRICMLIQTYWPAARGGTETQCRNVARALRARGHTVTVVTRRRSMRHPRREGDAGIPVIRLGLLSPLVARVEAWRAGWYAARAPAAAGGAPPAHAGSRKPRWFTPVVWLQWVEWLLLTVAIGIYFRRHRGAFDVLHVHESHWLAGLGVWAGRLAGIPVVVKEANLPVMLTIPHGIPFARIWDRLRRQASYIALTDAARQALMAAGIPAEQAVRIPNGVPIPEATAPVTENRDVVFVANLYQGAAHKAMDIVFDAWQTVCRSRPSGRLVVAGGGDAAPWQAYCRARGIDQRVAFIGFQKDPSVVYRSAAVFILLSRHEGLSNALLEAQSWGIPAVVSDIPGNRAVILNGQTGLIVPVDDAPAAAAALGRLLDDPALRRRYGAAARRRVETEFSIDAVAGRLIELYQYVVAAASRRGPTS